MNSNLLDQDWAENDTETFDGSTNPYAATPYTNVSIPTPVSLSNSVFVDPRQSPSQGRISHDVQYSAMSHPDIHHGLGITAGLDFMPPSTFSFELPPVPILQSPFQDPSPSPGDRTRRVRPRQAPGRGGPIAIAPNPAGVLQIQEQRSAVRDNQKTQRHTRRRSRRQNSPLKQEQDMALWGLRFNEQLSWKEIVQRMDERYEEKFNPSRLQMRLMRMRKRSQQWSEDDTRVLRTAHEYWETKKFEIIAQKMREFGASRSWTAGECELRWRDVECVAPRIDPDPEDPDAPPARRQRRQ
ncbi:hypothetical protein AJ80_08016 [Polytolypa hystricis UAMH7299]|uniref:Myb-like domain-containing protein n=1 Tax=Polytolypa hystricis (strain UAMH7299) TaxID=1447883 RepID=A0A2B7XEL4_POLH7|nr:hypothetical protein AJ80_08016 [Polytolypa hystricis UAMH7299]